MTTVYDTMTKSESERPQVLCTTCSRPLLDAHGQQAEEIIRGPKGEEIGRRFLWATVSKHPDDYRFMCRGERKRLNPHVWARWTAEDHPSKHVGLTWPQQEIVWAHMDAWEAFFDGQMTLEQARQHVSYLEPLPRVMSMKGLAKKMTVHPKADRKGPAEDLLLAAVRPVPEPTTVKGTAV